MKNTLLQHDITKIRPTTDCGICHGTEKTPAYYGPIRLGRFGQISQESYMISECLNCGARALPTLVEDLNAFYESDAYRQEVNLGGNTLDYCRIHDEEVLRHLTITGNSGFRGKVAADIGCGGGSFLDAISGFTEKVIAIEPAEAFQQSLHKRGYITYPYTNVALPDFSGKVDIAVSFSVIEHIEYPLPFLQEIHQLLTPEGRLFISTPNADDLLLKMLPEEYSSFFYRKAHLWYFTARSFVDLLRRAGFGYIRLIPHQRFSLGNFLGWIQNKAPSGHRQYEGITSAMDQIWRTELERTLRCDYLYAECRPTA